MASQRKQTFISGGTNCSEVGHEFIVGFEKYICNSLIADKNKKVSNKVLKWCNLVKKFEHFHH